MGTIYMKRAVITGPTGSIGIALINELEANGIEVVAVVRPGSKLSLIHISEPTRPY